LGRSRLVVNEDPEDFDHDNVDTAPTCLDAGDEFAAEALIGKPVARRVDVVQSPFLNTHYQQHPVRLTLDTGATTNMIRSSVVKAISIPTQPASQMARQADGVTPRSR
jgi:hypothetical protein